MEFYQVDSFAKEIFMGNPAAVVLLDSWLEEEVMQQIGNENNLSETAFLVPGDNAQMYEIRWFTPTSEVDLCGHATLAAAHVLFNEKKVEENELVFETRNRGSLKAIRGKDGAIKLDFPADVPVELTDAEKWPESLIKGLEATKPTEVWEGVDDYLVLFENEEQVRSMKPDFAELKKLEKRAVIVTSAGKDSFDFISRLFAPVLGVDEDPFTGSAHCTLTPFWSKKLEKKEFKALQASERTGEAETILEGDRVFLIGHARTVISGTFHI